MTRFRRSAGLSLLVLLAACVSYGQWLEIEPSGAPPQVFVYSESGTSWEFVDTTAPLVFNLKARGRCYEDSRMREAYICAGHYGNASCIEPTVNQSNRSFSADDGREWKPFIVNRQYVAPTLPAATPADVCNGGLQARLAQQGDNAATRARILRDGFRLTVPEAYRAWFSLTCEPQTVFFKDWKNLGDDCDVPAEIVCVGSADAEAPTHRLKPKAHRLKPEAHRMAPEPGIKNADIWINPKTAASYTGECPARLHVGGEVAYLLPDENAVDVHYRYQVGQGRRSFSSPIFKATFKESGKKFLQTWPFDVAPPPPAAGGLAAPGEKASPVLDGEIELVVLGSVPGARSPSTSFHVTCTSVEAPVAGDVGLAGRDAPSQGSTGPAERRMAASSRFGGWRVGFPIRDTGRTGLNAGSFVVEVPTQTVSPGDEITVILYPAPGTPGVSARRIPLKRVKKVDGFTIKQKVARSRVLSDGSLEIHVVAPAECGCTLTGLVDPAPPQ